MLYRLHALLIAAALGTAMVSCALLAQGNVWASLVFLISLVLVVSLVLHLAWTRATRMINQRLEKSDESPMPKQQKALLEKMVAIPSLSSIVLVILITTVIAAIFFTWLQYQWQHGHGAPL